jgi:hypothetical protein
MLIEIGPFIQYFLSLVCILYMRLTVSYHTNVHMESSAPPVNFVPYRLITCQEMKDVVLNRHHSGTGSETSSWNLEEPMFSDWKLSHWSGGGATNLLVLLIIIPHLIFTVCGSWFNHSHFISLFHYYCTIRFSARGLSSGAYVIAYKISHPWQTNHKLHVTSFASNCTK